MKFLKLFFGVVIFFGGIWGSVFAMYLLCPLSAVFIIPGVISLVVCGAIGSALFISGLSEEAKEEIKEMGHI